MRVYCSCSFAFSIAALSAAIDACSAAAATPRASYSACETRPCLSRLVRPALAALRGSSSCAVSASSAASACCSATSNGARVDREQQLARLDVLAFGEVRRSAISPVTCDRTSTGRRRLDVADAPELHGHRLRRSPAPWSRRRLRPRLRPPRPPVGRRRGAIRRTAAAARQECQAGHEEPGGGHRPHAHAPAACKCLTHDVERIKPKPNTVFMSTTSPRANERPASRSENTCGSICSSGSQRALVAWA